MRIFNLFKYLKHLRKVANNIKEHEKETKRIWDDTRALLNSEDDYFKLDGKTDSIFEVECECRHKRSLNAN